jgi:hypothetical protein
MTTSSRTRCTDRVRRRARQADQIGGALRERAKRKRAATRHERIAAAAQSFP